MEATKKRGRPKKVLASFPSAQVLPFCITIQIGNAILQGTGATALEALQSIPRPLKITHKGVLTITHGSLKKVMLFNVERLQRLFYPKAQPLFVKNLTSMMKDAELSQ